ncbi:MAG: ABC transporter ATP-binding protein [Acidimicrobiia bacterium]
MVEAADDLLRVEGLTKRFAVRRGLLRPSRQAIAAVTDVSFSVAPGETLGLVGESGSGKSTTGRMIVRLVDPSAGRIVFEGRDITTVGGAELRRARRNLQMVFQDPFASLDPHMTVADVVAEPLRAHHEGDRRAVRRRAGELLELVGLTAAQGARRPAAFSGGQRQRIGIARALALSPRLVVLDEPVSALDVSVQAQVLNLLDDLQRTLGVSFLLISHDLSVVRHVARRVAVMYMGRIVEVGETARIFAAPAHPYTQALLSAVPAVEVGGGHRAERIVLRGEPPDPVDLPAGCAFRGRCWRAGPGCDVEVPRLAPVAPGQDVACLHPVADPLAEPPDKEAARTA